MVCNVTETYPFVLFTFAGIELPEVIDILTIVCSSDNVGDIIDNKGESAGSFLTAESVDDSPLAAGSGCRIKAVKVLGLFIIFRLTGAYITVITDSEGYGVDSGISGVVIHLFPGVRCRFIFPCIF